MNSFFKHFFTNNFYSTQIESNINQYYHLSNDDLLNIYNQRFLHLYNKAVKFSKFYINFYGEHGVDIHSIKDITDINKLPVINKHIIKDKVEDIYVGKKYLKFKSYTSGTTGSPLTVYRTPISINIESAYVKHYRRLHGFNYGDKLLSIRGYLDKSKFYKYNRYSNVLYISSPNINSDTIDYFYRLIVDFAPNAVEGFPSYLYKLFLELQKKELHLNIPISFTSSEMLHSFQQEKIVSFFNTSLFDWYGNVERTIALSQHEDFIYRPMPLYSINEFNSDHVITTSLINTDFPLIRYYVDDSIEVTSNDFLKNILSPDIKKISGRRGDTIDLKDGSTVGCIDHAFKGIEHLDLAQIHQYGLEDPLQIKLVVNNKFSNFDQTKLLHNLKKMIGDNQELDFFFCKKEELTYTPASKFRLIIKH